MDETRFDRLAKGLAARLDRRDALRGVAAVAAAAAMPVAGIETAEAARFDRNCRRFIIAGGDDRKKKLRHVDDDIKVEVRRKRGKKFKTVWEDNDKDVNVNREPFKPIKFKARVGDQVRITGYNAQKGGCGLDELWLFCKDGGRGVKIMDRYRCSTAEGNTEGVFLTKTIRIK